MLSKADNQAFSDFNLENGSTTVTTTSTSAISSDMSSKSDSLVVNSESASHSTHNQSNSVAASIIISSSDDDKRGRSPSQAVSRSYSNRTSSYHYEVAASHYQKSETQGSARDASSSTCPTALTDEGCSSQARSNMTILSGTPDHSVESGYEKITESTCSIDTEAKPSMSHPPSSVEEYQASTTRVGSVEPQTASSQESFPSSHSTHHSTSTDEPEVITPELHPSRLDVTLEESDAPCSTPPLSPDDNVSMTADTTIGTIESDENLFFNGDLALKSAMDLSLTKPHSEEEEDSDDEDVPDIPLLLFDQSAPAQRSVSCAISRKEMRELIQKGPKPPISSGATR